MKHGSDREYEIRRIVGVLGGLFEAVNRLDHPATIGAFCAACTYFILASGIIGRFLPQAVFEPNAGSVWAFVLAAITSKFLRRRFRSPASIKRFFESNRILFDAGIITRKCYREIESIIISFGVVSSGDHTQLGEADRRLCEEMSESPISRFQLKKGFGPLEIAEAEMELSVCVEQNGELQHALRLAQHALVAASHDAQLSAELKSRCDDLDARCKAEAKRKKRGR